MKKVWNAEEKLQYERALLAKGIKYIAGVDEVGRGPLAGPVVCAAVIMPLDDESIIVGVDDSKKLSAKKRETLAEEIKKRALAYTIVEVSEKEIDEINILEATKLGMKKALESLSIAPETVLTDGNIPCISTSRKGVLFTATPFPIRLARQALSLRFTVIR
jgi:ribonuclease HII